MHFSLSWCNKGLLDGLYIQNVQRCHPSTGGILRLQVNPRDVLSLQVSPETEPQPMQLYGGQRLVGPREVPPCGSLSTRLAVRCQVGYLASSKEMRLANRVFKERGIYPPIGTPDAKISKLHCSRLTETPLYFQTLVEECCSPCSVILVGILQHCKNPCNTQIMLHQE